VVGWLFHRYVCKSAILFIVVFEKFVLKKKIVPSQIFIPGAGLVPVVSDDATTA
jgi:hypothetical protein